MEELDLVIIGAGPAGLNAALTAIFLKLRFEIFDASSPGGTPTHAFPWKPVDDVLGFPASTGAQIAEKMVCHLESLGAKINCNEAVTKIAPKGEGKTIQVETSRGKKLNAKAIIIAIGTSGTPNKLGIKGEELGGVFYRLASPEKLKGKKVIVVGGGDSAAEIAIELKKRGVNLLCLAHRKEQLRAQQKYVGELQQQKIPIEYCCELKEIKGKNCVEKAVIENTATGKKKELAADAIIIAVGATQGLAFLKNAGIKLKADIFVEVDSEQKTSVQGIFAAGDITGRLKRIPIAVAEGQAAVYTAFKYIKKPYWG